MAVESAVAPEGGPASSGAGLEARAAARAATVAAMEAGQQFDANAPVDAKSIAPKPVPSDASAADAEPSPVIDEAADAPDPIVEAKPDEKPDTELAKRMSAVQNAEKRAREALAKERAEAKAEIERERAELAAWKAERDQFEQLKARAKYDPAAVLASLGLSEEDLEPAARDLYARSKGAQNDPKTRDAALKMQRDREHADRLAALEKQNAELREQFTKQTEAQRQEAAFTEHLASVRKVANGATPLFEKAPAIAQAAVAKVTLDLWNETGEYPDAADVITTLEKRLPDMLTVAQHRQIFGDAAPATKAAPPPAPAPARTLGADITGATPVPKESKLSLAERRAETTRLMEQGKLDPA
jgi:hypothetical protein